MNINVDRTEEEHFTIEDIVSYSNIEISHINDNRAPMMVVAKRVVVWAIVLSLLAGLFFF